MIDGRALRQGVTVGGLRNLHPEANPTKAAGERSRRVWRSAVSTTALSGARLQLVAGTAENGGGSDILEWHVTERYMVLNSSNVLWTG